MNHITFTITRFRLKDGGENKNILLGDWLSNDLIGVAGQKSTASWVALVVLQCCAFIRQRATTYVHVWKLFR